jgi:fatty-acid peroxygenase
MPRPPGASRPGTPGEPADGTQSEPPAGTPQALRERTVPPRTIAGKAGRAPTHVGGADATLALLRDPYRFISRECRARGIDVAEARLLLRPTLLLTGPSAGALFYDADRFERAGAAPRALRATLFGERTVQSLDGAAHLRRKGQLMSALGEASLDRLLAAADLEWARAGERWRGGGVISLYDALHPLLARAACRWAGVPLGGGDDEERRVAALVALFDAAGSGPLQHLRSRRSRQALESWLAGLVQDERRKPGSFAAGSPAARLTRAEDLAGRPLPARIAAAEILNLVRPTVAVSVWIVFALHAVHTQPAAVDLLRARSDDATRTAVIQEVRRHYPFFPAVLARVRRDFEWKGIRFRRGRRAMFDLYGTDHDPRAWPDPDAFRPERFLGLPDPPRYAFVPQGGGRAETGHRCPGERIAVRLAVQALAWLGHRLPHELPAQDLSIAFERLPAIPRDRMRVRFL